MIKEFLRDKSLAHLLMLAALVLLFVSQFFNYFDDPTTGSLNRTSDGAFVAHDSAEGSVIFGPIGQGVAAGWDLHPQAYVILAILAFAFLRSEIFENIWFRRIGWWLAVGLIVWASSPGAPFAATGAAMGGVAFLMAVAAAVLNLFSPKSAIPPKAARP